MRYNWTHYPVAPAKTEYPLHWQDERWPETSPYLAYGQGRSYGDCCLNENGTLLLTENLKRFIAFDNKQGYLRCEAGVSLHDILQLIVPHGWMLPVVPGTQWVSVGGAIANDVHGKNHHEAGSFGCHITQFELLRSDGSRLLCSPHSHPEYYAATIGGLGLTGLITWVELKLQSIPGPFMATETQAFQNLDEFFKFNAEAEQHYDYTVAWLDCLSKGSSFGRGLLMSGNFIEQTKVHQTARTRSVPCYFPSFVLNRYSISAFNHRYFKQGQRSSQQVQYYQSFFFPLDSINHWNRIYGKRGFLQYQCVIPAAQATAGISELLHTIVNSQMGSFLSTLKSFGQKQSAGLLSFPMPGTTLALDFPYHPRVLAVLDKLDQIVMTYRGRVYPAKDARMSAAAFQSFFPNWQQFSQYIDPKFSSSFWRRVTGSVV